MPTKKLRPIPELTPEQKQRLALCYTAGTPDECWEWQGRRTPEGYGLFWTDTDLLAHRVVYSLSLGVDITNIFLLHRCDNPPCVNPSHCFEGSLDDNNKDRHRKGRSVMPKNRSRGAANGRAKLDDEKVAEIRRRYAQGETQQGLAREFGVSGMSIWAIVHNHYWHHVKLNATGDN